MDRRDVDGGRRNVLNKKEARSREIQERGEEIRDDGSMKEKQKEMSGDVTVC